jgi:hypothetical protein
MNAARVPPPILKAFKSNRLDLYASTNILVNQKFAAFALPADPRRLKPAAGAPPVIAPSRRGSFEPPRNHHLLSPIPE